MDNFKLMSVIRSWPTTFGVARARGNPRRRLWNKEISRTNCRTVSDMTWDFVYVLQPHVQEVLKKSVLP